MGKEMCSPVKLGSLTGFLLVVTTAISGTWRGVGGNKHLTPQKGACVTPGGPYFLHHTYINE